MKVLNITRKVNCPKEQIVEKEIWGDTVKHRKRNWPLPVYVCIRCQYHVGITHYSSGESPTVTCEYDDR